MRDNNDRQRAPGASDLCRKLPCMGQCACGANGNSFPQRYAGDKGRTAGQSPVPQSHQGMSPGLCTPLTTHQQPLSHRQCDGLETHRTLLESEEISSLPLICTASPPQFTEHSYIALRRGHIHHLFLKYLFIGLCQALVGACRISSCGR